MRALLAAALPALLLLSGAADAAVTEVPLPLPTASPLAVAFDADGALWVSLDGPWALARLDPADPAGSLRLANLSVPSAGPGDSLWSVRLAEDGGAWTASQTHVHRVDPATFEARAWPLPNATQLAGDLAFADGKVVVAEVTNDALAVLDPGAGTFTRIATPRGFGPLAFEHGAGGSLLVSGTYAGGVARVDVAAGRVEPVLASGLQGPVGIAVDGGHVWAAEMGASSVARVALDGGAIERWPVSPSPFYPIAGPSEVLVRPDGIWIVEHFADRVARLDTDAGTLVEWMMPSAPGTNVQRAAFAPDGALWLAEWSKDRLARVDAEGAPAFPDVPARVTVAAGTKQVASIAGIVSAGSADPALAVGLGSGVVQFDATNAAPGEYRVLLSSGTREALAGRYVTVEVTAPPEAPNDAPAAAWLLAVLAVAGAAATLRRRRP